MLKKRILAIGLAMVTVLGSSMVVSAAEIHTHAYIKETYSHTTLARASHQYLYAYYDDGTKEYRTCYYDVATVYLNLTCSICGLDSGKDTSIYGGERNHVCPPDQRP